MSTGALKGCSEFLKSRRPRSWHAQACACAHISPERSSALTLADFEALCKWEMKTKAESSSIS